MKFSFSVEIDSKDIAAAAESFGQIGLQAMQNPQIAGFVAQIAAQLGLTSGPAAFGRGAAAGVAATAATLGPRGVTPIRREPPPWATPEARARAEAAGPPPIPAPWTERVDPALSGGGGQGGPAGPPPAPPAPPAPPPPPPPPASPAGTSAAN